MRPVAYTWDNAMVEGRRRLALLEHSLDPGSRALVSRRIADASMSERGAERFASGCAGAWGRPVVSR